MLNDIFEYNYNLSLLNLYSYTDCTLFKSFMGGGRYPPGLSSVAAPLGGRYPPWSIERSCAVGGRYPPWSIERSCAVGGRYPPPLGGATPFV